MLYKVTPMMPTAQQEKARKVREPGQPKKRRKTAIYDADGHEVLITLMCLKCRSMKPLAQFGLRKMADGAIRNQPWCRTCRGSAGTKKKGGAQVVEAEVQPLVIAADAPVLDAAPPVEAFVAVAEAAPSFDAGTASSEVEGSFSESEHFDEPPADPEATAPGESPALQAAPASE